MPTQSQIRQLQNPDRTTDIYPLTVEEAVFDDDGVQLPSKLTQLYGDIADVEATTTATRAYSVGDYVVCRGQLYKATASIAIGDTIEEGVNVESVTITDELKSGGAVTGVKGNAEPTYRKGNVNLTLANLGYESVNNLTTTATGKLLDARQGKALNDNFAKAFADLATVEPTATASKAYATNEYLVYNGQLYKVTSAIASGGTITPGTNVTAVKITDEMGAGGGAIDYLTVQNGKVCAVYIK